MARRTKVTPARRKRRWIGLKISENIPDKDALESILDDILIHCKSWKIYDFEASDGISPGFAIIRIDRIDERYVREVLFEERSGVISCTTSGKIKLVRERIFS